MADRRDFIKNSCTLCLGVLTVTSVSALLEGCTALPLYKASAVDNQIHIPKASFSSDEKMKMIRCESLDYDILLVLQEDKNHQALLMKCTHADNILIANLSGLSCNLHGSTFNLKGEVTNGPANFPLQKFLISEDNNNISIHIK
jgi:Rieske Fe-S protein